MNRILVCVFVVCAVGVSPAWAQFRVTTFQIQPDTRSLPVKVQLQSTEEVTGAELELLQRTLRVAPLDRLKPAERSLFVAEGQDARLDPRRAQIKVDAVGPRGERWAWTWPDAFTFVRPGIIEVTSRRSEAQHPRTDGVGILRQALHGAPHEARGRILCQGVAVQFISVVIAGQGSATDASGVFRIHHEFPGVPATVFIAFDGKAQLGALSIPLQIMDDGHTPRNERVDRDPTLTGDVADFGDIEVPGTDCRLWQRGFLALQRYVQIMNAAPPAGGLRIKRWANIPQSVGAPHTFYDYIVAPTDLATTSPDTIFHEFGHTIAFVADGSKSHWDWDNTRFIYARVHGRTTIHNKALAFSEGWANYWRAAHSAWTVIGDGSGLSAGFLDFNESQIASRLMVMAQAVPIASGAPADDRHKFMVQLFLDNPGVMHTLQQFEERYCAVLANVAGLCGSGLPLRAAPSCPPGYHDDGLTCRRENVVAKPSLTRGAGTTPSSCGPGRELDAGLCYPLCAAGTVGVGPVCWQVCPSGYSDDGATCRRAGEIIGANNSACPWHDKCGLVTARGCSVCPAGYQNDGCTCRKDPHIFGKGSQPRGAGTPPAACGSGLHYDAGLCYAACPGGMTGTGPVCWGTCPAGFDDHGATCYREPHVMSKDPVVPP